MKIQDFNPLPYFIITNFAVPYDGVKCILFSNIRLLVFGIGKRSCVGEIFAKSRIFLFLATVLRNFTIMEPDDGGLPDLLPREMESVGVILQPKPYEVRFVLRRK